MEHQGDLAASAKGSFLQDFKAEFKKISWTSRGELIGCTKIVIGVTFAFGFGIYGVDLFVRTVLQGLHSLLIRIF